MPVQSKTPLQQTFARDEKGAVAITFALVATLLFGFTALAVDISRHWNATTKIGQGLDAAALAGAKLIDRAASDGEIQTAVQAYFAQHIANMNIGGVTINPLQIAIDRRVSTVNATATGTMDTTFARVIGYDTLNFNKTSEVSYKLRKVEVVLSLDTTGSMAPAGKIDALKSGAKDVVDVLFDEAANEEHVKIGLVPWAAAVNAGSLAPLVSNNQSVDQCVLERLGSSAATDAAPYGANALRASPGPAPNPYQFYECPLNVVTPMRKMTSRDFLKSEIDSYTTTGGTAGHIGTAWGYYMLSPDWASVLPAESQPKPFNPADTLKAIVILTDGEFNMSYVTPGAYNPAQQTDESYQMFQSICTQMRQRRILVYTIGFQLNNARAQAELAACSEEAGQTFTAATNDELKATFRKIAQQIMQLRVSK
jgi:Flp pilus assembly protein TadG